MMGMVYELRWKSKTGDRGPRSEALSGNTDVDGEHRRESGGVHGAGTIPRDRAEADEGHGVTRCGRGGVWRILWLSGWLAIAAGSAAGQGQTGQDQTGQAPAPPPGNKEPASTQEKKDDPPNPAQVAAEVTKKVGQAAFVKARDWESGWVAGAYVGKNRQLVSLTGRQRQEVYLQDTWTRPGAYMARMFTAGIDQARGTPREWGGGWGGYGKRFGSREGQFIASNSLTALANASLQYEPRYDQCRCSGFRARTRHAILRNFLTYNRTEQELRPQWGLYAGAFGGGLISTAWKPHPRNAFAEGGRAMAGQVVYGVLLNVFVEFADEMNRKLGERKKER